MCFMSCPACSSSARAVADAAAKAPMPATAALLRTLRRSTAGCSAASLFVVMFFSPGSSDDGKWTDYRADAQLACACKHGAVQPSHKADADASRVGLNSLFRPHIGPFGVALELRVDVGTERGMILRPSARASATSRSTRAWAAPVPRRFAGAPVWLALMRLGSCST